MRPTVLGLVALFWGSVFQFCTRIYAREMWSLTPSGVYTCKSFELGPAGVDLPLSRSEDFLNIPKNPVFFFLSTLTYFGRVKIQPSTRYELVRLLSFFIYFSLMPLRNDILIRLSFLATLYQIYISSLSIIVHSFVSSSGAT